MSGTGEAWVIRDSDVMGNGIYKSTDAGNTWRNVGLPDSGRIGRIVIHPSNPDIVFACVLGRATGPQQERGVYRTTDGGQTWDIISPDLTRNDKTKQDYSGGKGITRDDTGVATSRSGGYHSFPFDNVEPSSDATD